MTITADQLAALVSAALDARGLELVTSDELAALKAARADLEAARAEGAATEREACVADVNRALRGLFGEQSTVYALAVESAIRARGGAGAK